MNTTNPIDLIGEVAVVTGGAGRLGSNYAKTLADAGARVAIVDIVPREVPLLADHAQAGKVIAVVADITDKKAVQAAYKNIVSTLGTPTILINNAGIDTPPDAPVESNGPFEDFPEEVWSKVLDSHLKGALLMSQEFIRAVRVAKVPHASIINISSTYGVVTPDQSLYDYRRRSGETFYKPVAYSVAKSGMLNFTRWLAEYAAPYGVRVNTLVPGGVYVGQQQEFVTEYNRRTILGRMAEETEYNGAILFLSSHAMSSYMTGSTLIVDGGWTAR